MVSTNQSNTDSQTYATEHEKIISEKPTRVILSIVPTDKADARAFLGAANKLDASKRIKEHFANCIKRLED